MQKLHEDHGNFRRLLDLMERELDASEPSLIVLRDAMHYLVNYADYFHHPLEDLVFARVTKHDLAIAAIIEKVEMEHHTLPALGRELLVAFAAGRDCVTPQWETLSARARAYADRFHRHKEREEAEIFPVIKTVLTDADYLAVQREAKWREDPLFGRHVAAGYRSVLERLS